MGTILYLLLMRMLCERLLFLLLNGELSDNDSPIPIHGLKESYSGWSHFLGLYMPFAEEGIVETQWKYTVYISADVHCKRIAIFGLVAAHCVHICPMFFYIFDLNGWLYSFIFFKTVLLPPCNYICNPYFRVRNSSPLSPFLTVTGHFTTTSAP